MHKLQQRYPQNSLQVYRITIKLKCRYRFKRSYDCAITYPILTAMRNSLDRYNIPMKFRTAMLAISYLCCAGALLLSQHVSAQAANIATGGVQFLKHPSLSIQRQDIHISLDQITVNYIFINNSPLDLIETMVFPVPTLNYDKAHNQDEEPLQNFSIAANGREVDIKTLNRPVSFAGEDLSTFFSSLGISVNPIEAMAQINANYNSFASAKGALLQRDLIEANSNTAKWFTRTYYYWQQKFPPAEEVHIQQIYKPHITVHRTMPYPTPKVANDFWNSKNKKSAMNSNKDKDSKNYTSDEDTDYALQKELSIFNNKKSNYDSFLQQFCPGKNDRATLLHNFSSPKDRNQPIIARELSFDLGYDHYWSSPIAHFTLKVEQPSSSMALLCWPMPMQRINDTAVIYEAKNYSPVHDIHLLFVDR